ncbi:MAG: heme o synthase [Bdellovibrionota bacterium]
MSRAPEATTVFDSSFDLSRALTHSFGVICDLISLTKPRILTLLLISTCCPMVLAAQGSIPYHLLAFALLGGALISGSASALNCVWDRDIDTVMERTKDRPLPRGRLSVSTSVIFALLLGLIGFVVLYRGLNPMAAGIALFGHFFYVVIYTMWLKRSTPQNIVIGGAAGAIPPIVGWVGVTGRLDYEAMLLFLIIFLWTPPHFWALALNKNSDYQRAGVPMLPVVSGERTTHKQMLWYALSLIPVSGLLVYSSAALGWFSLTVLLSLGVIFAYKVFQLMCCIDEDGPLKTRKAWDVFGFSLIYLALFFVCLVVDSALI